MIDCLNCLSHGGIGGVEILGIGFDGSLAFVEETMDYREEGLPENLIVVKNVGEWLYCLDCNTGKVVSWSIDDDVKPEFDSFDEFVIAEFKDAIENL